MTFEKLFNLGKEAVLKVDKEESAALILLEHVAQMDSHVLYTRYHDECEQEIEQEYIELLNLYIKENIPVQYIVGYSSFFGYEFNVNKDVLIPRFETEELVENILYHYDDFFPNQKVKVVDIGTGSGCIGITLSLEEPNMEVTITDISEEALIVAKSNAIKFDADVEILQGNMLEPVRGRKFDILVSNPPYIPQTEQVMSLVKDNEPNLALFGGEDGLMFYRIILSQCNEILNEKAIIAFEHAFDKGEEMKKLALTYFPEAKVEVLQDMQGLDRMTIIVKGF